MASHLKADWDTESGGCYGGVFHGGVSGLTQLGHIYLSDWGDPSWGDSQLEHLQAHTGSDHPSLALGSLGLM